MTYDREFYTIFVVDKRTIRYFCGEINELVADEKKESVTFPLVGAPCINHPAILRARPLAGILSAYRTGFVDGQRHERSLSVV